MFRRRSAFSRRSRGHASPLLSKAIWAGGALAFVAGFVFLLHVADESQPARVETRIELPNAFAQ